MNMERICKGSADRLAKLIRCYTMAQAQQVITDPYFKDPEAIIIHTGTNDLELIKSDE